MLKKSFLPLLFLSIFIYQNNNARSFFDEFDDELFEMPEKMMQQMKKMRKKAKASTHSFSDSSPLTTVSISESKKGVIITIANITAETLSANLNDIDNLLSIETDGTSIHIQAHDSYISVATMHEAKCEKEKNQKQFFYSSSSSQTSERVARPVDLEKQTIEYDKDQKVLTITFEYQQKKQKGKPVPVNVVSQKEA